MDQDERIREALRLLQTIQSDLESIKAEKEHSKVTDDLIDSLRILRSDSRLQTPSIMWEVKMIGSYADTLCPLIKDYRLNRVKAKLSYYLSQGMRNNCDLFDQLCEHQERLARQMGQNYPILCDPSSPISARFPQRHAEERVAGYRKDGE
ncbi:hypothetical protein NPX13_g1653 [Xylaria arbuscula]|uniref:Uncharacterized protein n=1 Tax=Xylaria arbuscula TaxID=114810 RepID=A0A9W8NLM9_9PEZI|nr:hypothetical protein NPX13_g1653 [Xylaria arbuscula]